MIYYLIGDYPGHSWGNGIIYSHVGMLRDAGFDAFALHHHAPFRPDWLEIDVPIRYVDGSGFGPDGNDIVVVPKSSPRAMFCNVFNGAASCSSRAPS